MCRRVASKIRTDADVALPTHVEVGPVRPDRRRDVAAQRIDQDLVLVEFEHDVGEPPVAFAGDALAGGAGAVRVRVGVLGEGALDGVGEHRACRQRQSTTLHDLDDQQPMCLARCARWCRLGCCWARPAVPSSVLHARAHHSVEKLGSECVNVSGHCRVALSLFTLLPPRPLSDSKLVASVSRPLHTMERA